MGRGGTLISRSAPGQPLEYTLCTPTLSPPLHSTPLLLYKRYAPLPYRQLPTTTNVFSPSFLLKAMYSTLPLSHYSIHIPSTHSTLSSIHLATTNSTSPPHTHTHFTHCLRFILSYATLCSGCLSVCLFLPRRDWGLAYQWKVYALHRYTAPSQFIQYHTSDETSEYVLNSLEP